jgi:hypothetical protein
MSATEKPAIPKIACTPTEAAMALGVSYDYFSQYIADELRWARRGRKKLVAISELQRWLDTNSSLTLEDE